MSADVKNVDQLQLFEGGPPLRLQRSIGLVAPGSLHVGRTAATHISVAWSQYHLAVAGGCERIDDRRLKIDLRAGVPIVNLKSAIDTDFAPTRYREVVLTPCHCDLSFERASESYSTLPYHVTLTQPTTNVQCRLSP